MKSTSRATASRHLGWRKKTFFALLTTAGFFLCLEAVLSSAGLGNPDTTSDPFVGFSNQIPLFDAVHAADGSVTMRTADNKRVWFNDQQFLRKKPPGTRRVFCLGGSTTYGRPFADSTSFCGWLREYLPLADDTSHWEVINAGGISYASYRVAAVMQELVPYEPDLFIVYTGHNEFLERRTYADQFARSSLSLEASAMLSRTRTWNVMRGFVEPWIAPPPPGDVLSGEVDEILNHTIGPADYHRDPQWHASVLKHFEWNLHRMAGIAGQADAALVFVVPAANEKDCSPFKSEAASDTNPQLLEAHLAAADTLLAADDPAAAVEHLDAANRLDPGFALTDFRRGQAAFRLGDYPQAVQSFRAAINHDVCPLRAPDAFLDTIRRVAKEHDATLVDFDRLLRDQTRREHGYPVLGNACFLDHVHPTIEMHHRLAQWILDALDEQGPLELATLQADQVQAVRQRVLARVDTTQQAIALRNLAKVFHWAGKFEMASARAEDALHILRDDPESLLILAVCHAQLGRREQAYPLFERLLDVAPLYGRGHLSYGEILLEQGDDSTALVHLEMAVALLPEAGSRRVDAYWALGEAYVRLQQYEQAMATLQVAADAAPDDPQYLFWMAQARAGAGDADAAITLYRQFLQRQSQHADAHAHLASLLLKTGRAGLALQHFETALEIEPEHVRARAGRDVARQIRQRPTDASERASGQ